MLRFSRQQRKGGKAVISNGKITYTPCANFCGTDTFTYSLCKSGCDKSTATGNRRCQLPSMSSGNK